MQDLSVKINVKKTPETHNLIKSIGVQIQKALRVCLKVCIRKLDEVNNLSGFICHK